jgi:outer membrane protein assembly factor BamB
MLVVLLGLGQQEQVLHEMSVPQLPPVDNWPMYQHDAQHTGRSTHIGPATNALKWKFADTTGPGGKLSSPATGPEGQVYAGGYNDLYAFHPDGSFAWKAPAGNCSHCAPAVAADGTVYAASNDGHLYAFSPDGAPQWTYAAGSALDDTPAIATDGTICYNLDDGIYAINADGTLKWSYTHPSGYWFGAPASGPGNVVYATCMAGLTALNADGTLRWEYSDLAGASFDAPVIDTDSSVYFMSPSKNLIALAADGVLRWKTDGSVLYRQGPAIAFDHSLYMIGAPSGGDDSLYALDASGNLLWQATTDATSVTMPLVNTDGAIVYGEGLAGESTPEYHHVHAVSALGLPLWTTVVKGAVLPRLAKDASGNIYCTAELYVANAGEHGRVYSLDQNGMVRWASGTGGIVSGSAVVGIDGRVYTGWSDGNVYALTPDGAVSWLYESDGSMASSSPAVLDDGTVYIPSIDNSFFAINDGGTLKWKHTGSYAVVESSPTIAPDGTVYFGDHGDTTVPIGNNGVFFALNPDGTLKWSQILETTIYASAAISLDSIIYISSATGELHAYETEGGGQWMNNMGLLASVQHSSVAIGTDGTLYLGGPENSLSALNPGGATQWVYAPTGQITGTPALATDGTIYVSGMDGVLRALNQDGTLAWSYSAGDAIYSSPAVDGAGCIYFGSWDHSLYALHPDGTLAWSYTTGGDIWTSPTIGLDGTIYIGSDDGNLYAIGPGVS